MGPFLDPASLSAVTNGDEEINELTGTPEAMLTAYGVAANSENCDIGTSDILPVDFDEEGVFNVTDSTNLTVQDAYLTSVRLGHFNGLEEHGYSKKRTPEKSPSRRSRASSHGTPPLVKSTGSPRQKTISESAVDSNSNITTPSRKRLLSSELSDVSSPKRKRLSLDYSAIKSPDIFTKSPELSSASQLEILNEDSVMHGSDTEGLN